MPCHARMMKIAEKLANVVCNASQVFPDAFYSRNIHLRDSTGESISRTGGCYMCDRCHGTLYADWALLFYCLFFGRGKIALTSGRYCPFSCPEHPLSVEGFNSVYTYWDIQSRMIHTEICLMLIQFASFLLFHWSSPNVTRGSWNYILPGLWPYVIYTSLQRFSFRFCIDNQALIRGNCCET